MTTITAYGIASIEADRREDEYGSLHLTILAEDGTRTVYEAGRYEDDATNLRDMLQNAADDLNRIIDDWQDVPDETDAYVSCDRGEYYVTLEGLFWNGAKLVSHKDAPRHGYPSEDIATYELARAMSETGCFPNSWSTGERGDYRNNGDDVRKYHDAGGTGLLPLDGVVFDDGDEVMTPDGWRAYVRMDYGNLGLTYVLSGDDEVHFTEDHDGFVLSTDDDEEG